MYVYIFSFSDNFVIVPNAFARPRVQAYLACPLLLVRASAREDRGKRAGVSRAITIDKHRRANRRILSYRISGVRNLAGEGRGVTEKR